VVSHDVAGVTLHWSYTVIRTPAHKQTNPALAAGQIVNPITNRFPQTISDVIDLMALNMRLDDEHSKALAVTARSQHRADSKVMA
jgi:hypothetical protein